MGKKFCLLIVFLILVPGALCAEERVVADFQNQPVNQFPNGWKVKFLFWYRDPRGSEPYTIVENQNNRYLKGVSKANAVTIGKAFNYDLNKYNHLSWRWKIDELPKDGAENKLFRSDSAAGLYVIFSYFRFIKYVWSSTLPLETVATSPFSPGTKIIVVRTGHQDTGVWLQEKRDLVQDYKRVFGKEPVDEIPKGIAILTDSDSTNSSAIASYDDIVVSSE